jgi:hypothetical protein
MFSPRLLGALLSGPFAKGGRRNFLSIVNRYELIHDILFEMARQDVTT